MVTVRDATYLGVKVSSQMNLKLIKDQLTEAIFKERQASQLPLDYDNIVRGAAYLAHTNRRICCPPIACTWAIWSLR